MIQTDIYLNVGQEDLRAKATWYEDLTGYAANLCYYAETDGVAAKVEKTATVTPGTKSTTSYDFTSDDDPFTESGYYVFWFRITKDGRSRSCRPRRCYIHVEGEGARAIP